MRSGQSAASVGIYVSVPFCRSKCSYCNFASGVFAAERMSGYVERVAGELRGARRRAAAMGAVLPQRVGSIYLGGGTPSLLPPELLRRIFESVCGEFDVEPDAEVTVECAPGQIADEVLAEMAALGVNRVSLGVQSFVESEAAAVGRRHTEQVVMDDMRRLRAAGIAAVNVDLIAGLPHQSEQSLRRSLDAAVGSGAEHVSVYMLEVDEDSRLGREVMAGGTRYHAHFVPEDERAAELYVLAYEHLERAGVKQYEISNFARTGRESRHNLRYWRREPYLGVGLDAHSMLERADAAIPAVRFANCDDFERYLAGDGGAEPEIVTQRAAAEEQVFLGMRLNEGMDLRGVVDERAQAELESAGLLETADARSRLTVRGRLLSNEVFARLLEAMPQTVTQDSSSFSNAFAQLR
jgi:oxygen-independent coproporphyrinogen-3 oxidase